MSLQRTKELEKSKISELKLAHGLSKEEIEKMKEGSQENAEADKKAREMADAINKADSLIFETEKQLEEFGDKLSEGNKTAIEAALAELKEAHKAQDTDRIESSMKTLSDAWNAASSEMYQATQGGENPAENTEGADTATDNGAGAEDVEFEEVEDK